MPNSEKGRPKCLFVIQDGLGDRPISELGHRTPLEAARTPNMDRLIRRGIAGLVDIVAPGVRVGTDVGHLALFEQDLSDGLYGRGPMEAAGVGILLEPGDVALRFNFATVDENLGIIDRRAGRIREGIEELCQSLSEMPVASDIKVLCVPTTEHRGAVILKGSNLSPEISDSDPNRDGEGWKILEVQPRSSRPDAARTAALLNEIIRKAHEILLRHPINFDRQKHGHPPANAIITRGAGGARNYVNLGRKRGLSIACVSGESTVLGLARLAGVTPLTSPEMTANLDTDLTVKADVALDALERYDMVYLHLKGADIAGHDRQPQLKKEFIEKTDEVLGEILNRYRWTNTLFLAFGADHSTPCELGEHSGDPVPVFLSGPGLRTDSVTSYGERACARGGLGRIRCHDFVATLFDYLVS